MWYGYFHRDQGKNLLPKQPSNGSCLAGAVGLALIVGTIVYMISSQAPAPVNGDLTEHTAQQQIYVTDSMPEHQYMVQPDIFGK